MRGSQFSERDQQRAARLVQEVEALPAGYDSAFYPGVLVRQGYQVQEEERVFKVTKDGQTLAVRVRLDGQTGESVGIKASPLWQEAIGSSLVQREDVATEPVGERTKVESQPQEPVRGEVSPGEIQPEPRGNEELMASKAADAGEAQAEDTEQPAGLQLCLQNEQTALAGEAVERTPELPQESAPAEPQAGTGAPASAAQDAVLLDIRATARGLEFSDRDQWWAAELVEEVEALPVGQTPVFYPRTLVSRGYEVREQESGAEEERAFEVSKDGQTLAVRIRLDGQTGESVGIEAHPLWREAFEPKQPQVVSAAESQPEVRNDEKMEDPRSAFDDTTGD
jgi:hypothetical protein